MANNKSAEKRNRQAIKARDRRRGQLSSLRTAVKKVRSAAEEGDTERCEELLPETIRLIDSMATKGVIHANSAARRKSRLVRLVRRSQAEAAS